MPGAAVIATERSTVTRPYPPESSTMISPSTSVCVIAVANERHGAVSAHGFESLPYEATNVRWAASTGALRGATVSTASRLAAAAAPRASKESSVDSLHAVQLFVSAGQARSY